MQNIDQINECYTKIYTITKLQIKLEWFVDKGCQVWTCTKYSNLSQRGKTEIGSSPTELKNQYVMDPPS